jgi:acetyl-CoA acyltransferase
MKRFGTTQRQIAAVAAKNHRHSQHNPLSQYRDVYTIDEVLAAPPITYPLTLPMCSPISDGAAAAVLCTEDRHAPAGDRPQPGDPRAGLRRADGQRPRPLAARAALHRTGRETGLREGWGRPGRCVGGRSARCDRDGRDHPGRKPGFCAFGEGGALAERGDTTMGGRIPVNPSGGLESKGHPVGATGIAQLHELVGQLRGEAGARQVAGAKIALAENGGGLQGIEEAVACITILGR